MGLKLPEVLTEEDLIKVVTKTNRPYHKLAFSLGLYECMRISEVVKLQPENVDKKLKLLYIISYNLII